MPEPTNINPEGTPMSPLLSEKKSDKGIATIYNEDEAKEFTFLRQRLESSKTIKSQSFTEFKGKNYYQQFNENEKIANTQLPRKKNEEDVVVSAGTIEQKLDSLLSNINNLNLELEVHAFDKENNRLTEAATVLEDVIHDTRVREPSDGGGDEEKRPSRQRELLKQGTVFVQEEWRKSFEIKKKLKGEFDGKFRNSATDWSEKLEKVFEGPSTSLLYGPNVFLGDITKFFMEDQPYWFVVIHQNYEQAKATYGKFENWKFVHRGKFPPSSEIEAGTGSSNETGNRTIYDNKWRLTEVKKDQVEIILYQDKPNDTFQIIINGVMMMPIGFPLSAVSPGGQYNVAKQVFRIINEQFAYGQAFVSAGSVQEVSKLIDEMLKLFVLKTRKSFMPPYINTSGKVISNRTLAAGVISMGIPPQSLVPVDPNQVNGITQGEVAVFKEFTDLINKSTVSEQFTGQQGKSGTTATEIVALQKQARLTLGLTILACSLLEKKLGYLRLWNIIANWFEAIDTKVEGVGDARKLVKVFRSVNREVSIEGEGTGERRVIVQEGKLPDAREIRGMELEEEKLKDKPIRKLFIDPKGLKAAKIFWHIIVTAKEKETSALFKLLFKEQLNDVLTLMSLGSKPNLDNLEEEFARTWGKSRKKLFQKVQAGPDIAGVSGAGGPGGGAPTPDQIQSRANANQGGGPALPAPAVAAEQ